MPDYDKLHKANIDQYAKQVEAIYIDFAKRIAKIADNPKAKYQKSFKFKNNLEIQRMVDKDLGEFNAELLETISKGVEKEWEIANTKNEALVRATIKSAKVLEIATGLTDHNISALQAFLARKENGLGLSDRVWKRTKEFRDELENHLQIGITNGDSANVVSRRIRQNLNEPDKLFRRVKDKNGKFILSKAAREFHPGQGVYRSSFKNARRLAGTETNMAYRKCDHLRWQNNPTIVGYEVKLSNAHPVYDICDPASGRYPKNFVFTGWHPNCFCYAVPILLKDEEFDKYIDSVLNDIEFDYTKSANYVKGVPAGFTDYIRSNQDRISNLKSAPYFVKDNFKNGSIKAGLAIV
jgi:hypothetical protein